MLHLMPLLNQVPLRGQALGRPRPRLGQCPPGTVGERSFSADQRVENFTCVPVGAGGGGAGLAPGSGGGAIMPGSGGLLPGAGIMPPLDQLVETYMPPAPGGAMPGALPGSGIPTGGGMLPGAGFDSGAFQPMSPALPLAPAGAPSMPSPGGAPPPPTSPMDPGYAYPVGGETPGAPGEDGERSAQQPEGEPGTNPLIVGGLSLAALVALVALLD